MACSSAMSQTVEIVSNLRPIIFGLKVRTRGPQPSICVRTLSLFTINNVKSEQSTLIMSDFRCIAWVNRSTSGFFHRYRCLLHSLGRVERSVKPVVTGNHFIVQVESAKRISLHHATRQGGICITIWAVTGPEISPPGGLRTRIPCRFRPGECWD